MIKIKKSSCHFLKTQTRKYTFVLNNQKSIHVRFRLPFYYKFSIQSCPSCYCTPIVNRDYSAILATRIIQSLYYSPASRCINAWMHSFKKNESYGSVNSHGLWACANILTPKTGTDQTRNTIALFWYS